MVQGEVDDDGELYTASQRQLLVNVNCQIPMSWHVVIKTAGGVASRKHQCAQVKIGCRTDES